MLYRRVPRPGYTLGFSGPFRLLITAILDTRAASGHIGVIAPRLFNRCPKPTTLTDTGPRRIRDVVRSVKFRRAGTGGVVKLSCTLYRQFSNRIPRAVSTLADLPKIKHGATGIILNGTFNIPKFPISARIVHIAKQLH